MPLLTRRSFLATSGAVLTLPLLTARCGRSGEEPAGTAASGVPSGRSDGVRTGGSRTVRIEGGHEVWVKQVGTGSVPVLTLHGGPGAPHFYLECFEDFLPGADVRFWYYDQLGCGFSDQPDDPSLWTIERFRDEVEQVRAALGLDRFVLYGHSWGGMLAIEYALLHPDRLSGLVISNMTASIPAYVAHVNALRAALPADVRTLLDRYEARGDYEAPEYQEALLTHLYSRYLCRLDPWPEPLQRAFAHLATPVYRTLQGPSEFTVTGTFKDWDRWADLPRLPVPTLLLVGRHDTMAVADVRRMGGLIPQARVVVCENGSHMSLYDDQATYFAALVPFLHDAHAGRFGA